LIYCLKFYTYVLETGSYFSLIDFYNNLIRNALEISEKLNSSISYIEIEREGRPDFNSFLKTNALFNLNLMESECYKLKTFLNEYIKFDDELTYIFENYFHNQIKKHALDAFQRSEYLNAIRNVFVEINSQLKEKYKIKTGEEEDGYKLMVRALDKDNPNALLLNNLETETDRNIQEGYKWLFVGCIRAIRNPVSHENISLTKKEAFHLLTLASQLFYKMDELS
jgi:uncharacterized protein (TIGR02391 family)